MKVEKRDGSTARKILTAMVVDPLVLSRIAGKWEEGRFKSPWENLVGKWCVTYYQKYGKSPNKDIEGIFERWAEKHPDSKTISAVEKLLAALSGEYKKIKNRINSDFVIDLAAEYFNKVKLTQVRDELELALEGGDAEDGIKLLSDFNRIEMGLGTGIDLSDDPHIFDDVFDKRSRSIIKMPGALAKFYGNALERDGFIALEGPDKTGKTWLLMDFFYRALQQGRKAAFFEIGDLSERQIKARLITRAARRPIDPIPKGILWPTYLESEGDTMKPEHKKIRVRPVQKEDAHKHWRSAVPKGMSKLCVYPNMSLTVGGVLSHIQEWERYNWVPDVVIVDYADLIAPMPGKGEGRDQIDYCWKMLRSISQRYHLLMITASQTDAAAYSTDLIDRSNFSGDKRKLAHVTGMVGINQNDIEKERGMYRLNWVVLRESEFSRRKCVHVASCLDLANSSVLSSF
jgi:hypothetical protein